MPLHIRFRKVIFTSFFHQLSLIIIVIDVDNLPSESVNVSSPIASEIVQVPSVEGDSSCFIMFLISRGGLSHGSVSAVNLEHTIKKCVLDVDHIAVPCDNPL